MGYYFSLQYSGIQKTVFRYNRLWSIAGISQILSHLNELEMVSIAQNHGGSVVVAGGGKFTARFPEREKALLAKEEIIKVLSITLPMLEFQSSPVLEGNSFQEIKYGYSAENTVVPGILDYLNEAKKSYRGFGYSFNPHLKLCDECSEYPAEHKDKEEKLCRICFWAKKNAKLNYSRQFSSDCTTLEKIYFNFLADFDQEVQVPLNLEDIFPEGQEKKRIAVWVSDLNNMNQKVPIWLNQKEDEIKATFDKVTQINVDIITQALKDTFQNIVVQREDSYFIPFRLIVAGGDDLCIVMDAKYVLKFATNLHYALKNKIAQLDKGHPLHPQWLQARSKDNGKLGQYCFGASFVITDLHTAFIDVHRLAEDLMREAKENTERKDNSINWQILSTDFSPAESLLNFHKPLFFESQDEQPGFCDYYKLCQKYHTLSSSKIFQLADILMEHFATGADLKKQILSLPQIWKKGHVLRKLLQEKILQDNNHNFHPQRLASLLELLTLYKEAK
ncbi:MAG: hypothetical protein Q9M37_02595 [Desulfonauticus sp.]|nr:hypothetical protein [Desulfonauticus sp.]